MRRIRLLSIVGLTAALLTAPTGHAASPDLVISQVYAAGGNSGAAYANDYVELFNRGGTTIDLGGWTLQYATATGTAWSATPLAGTVAPGRRYLVGFASGGAVGLALPAPDATDTTNLSATGGKLALVLATAPLTCGATAGSCSAVTAVHDLIGYGSATDFEGSAAPAPTSTAAATRAGGGCTDSDVNASDFSADPAAPHTSATAAAPCGGSAPAFAQSAAVAVTVQSAISLTLERASVSFGTVKAGDRPAAVSERVLVSSSDTAGYALSVHRTAFTPADLPLAITAAAPASGSLSAAFAGGALVALPTAADLLLGTSAARSASGGDAWPTSIAFAAPIPAVAAGAYTATLVYTVIGGTVTG